MLGLAGFVVGFAACAAVLAWASHDRPLLRIDIAFEHGACCSWQVWPGGLAHGELNFLPIQSENRAIVSVPIHRSRMDDLFISVGTQPGGAVWIRRIWLTRGSQTIGVVSADQLHHAAVYQATARPAGPGLVLRGTGIQPAINVPVALDTHESQLRLLLAKARSQPVMSFAGLLVLGCLILFLFGLAWSRFWVVAGTIALTAVATRALPHLTWRMHFHDSVSNAVGYASYVGRWKSRERAEVDGSYALAIALGALLPLGYLRWSRRDSRGSAAMPAEVHLPRLARIGLVTVPILIVGFFALPNLHRWVGPPPQYTPSWDGNNFLFWLYLIRSVHLAPIKDFYWIYGFQWLTDKSPPWGLLFSFGWFLFFWTLLSLGAFLSLARFFSGGSFAVRYSLLSAFWVTSVVTSDIPFETRYVAALACVLIFVSINARSDAPLSWKRALFTFTLFATIVFEPAQALYALVPITCFAAAELFVEPCPAKERLRMASFTVASVSAAVAAATLVYWLIGGVRDTLEAYRAFFFASSAYAYPNLGDGWIVHPTTLASFIFWSVPLTLILGISGFVFQRGRHRLPYAAVVALGLVGLMIMQKQILRPDISTQIWLPVVFGLAFWAVSDTMLIPSRRWFGLPALAGALFALVVVSGGYHHAVRAVYGGPERVFDSAQSLVNDRATFREQARVQFEPSTFARYTEYAPVVRALRGSPVVAGGGQVWILGDESPIVMMLGQSWPYYLNDMYDASPIFFQKKVLAALTEHPPARVVWHFAPTSMAFDGVPMPVRVPLLYVWAVRHLAPLQRVGQFEILGPRPKGIPVALSWWRRRIGIGIDLGRIPAVAHVYGGTCTGAGCSSFVVVHLQPDAPRPQRITIPIRVDGLSFQVTFESGPESTYVIPLDRIWFWAAVPKGQRSVLASQVPGATVEVVHRAPDDDVLY